MNIFVELIIKTILETFYLTGIVIVIGLLLGVLRNNTLKNFQRSFGSKALMITGFIGVPIHEISHAILAVLFRHRINSIKLLQKPDINGVMGYVNHSYSKNSVYQQVGNFFIGIAPIFGGIFSIIALMHFIIPKSYNKLIQILESGLKVTTLNTSMAQGTINSYIELFKSIFSLENFRNPYFYLFLFISICISSHISLSSADIKGASRGLGIIFVILLTLNIFGLSKYISEINVIRYNILLTGVLLVAVILSIITYIISLFARSIKI
ncbi:hypothetical protein [Clostridium paridis]|uniref:Uncharacterized protein n=1 Tax=Clostridium paridis TaxID=2803863 RepID=A0A937K3R1_9CLOT|nr:hypothetical protein [Clostridium paridis]MBL4930345.1 hypothetical protein [Clostridium paridis]